MATNSTQITEHNQQVLEQLNILASRYPASIENFEELVLKLELQDDSNSNQLTVRIENILKKLLMTLLVSELFMQNFNVDTTSPDWAKRCGIPEERLISLKQVLEAVCGGKSSGKLKRSVVISFIENVLECLGVSDLTEVLDIISNQIPRFATQLQQLDQLKLLRVINVLLKNVSKTQDYELRGRLHLALTKFLPFCHDSGFHFRAQLAKASEPQSNDTIQEDQALLHGVSYEFYSQFWELQKLLMEPSEIAHGGETLTRLKKMEHVLKEVQQYFDHNPAKQTHDVYSQPIKFLTNYNLLTLQLGDTTFRKTIMLQVLIFVHSLKHPLAKTPITLSEADKKVVAEIETISTKFLNSCGEEGMRLLEVMPKILEGEERWAYDKEHWKERKNVVLKQAQLRAEDEEKKKEQIRKEEKQLDKRRAEIKKLINQKMKIESGKLERLIQNHEPINLQTTPTYTSFSYYYSQAQSCYNSFDLEAGKQTEFETRSEYNMFQWKAMRSLYRQNVRDVWSAGDKADPKMKDYRLISLMSYKRDGLREEEDPEPTKKVKKDE